MTPLPDLVDIGANLTKCKRPEVLRQLTAAANVGVGRVISTGCDIKGSVAAEALAKWYNGAASTQTRSKLYFTAGVHPHSASSLLDAGKINSIALSTLESLARSPLCVAVGECGLDYDRMFSPRDAQLTAFDAQCALAARLGAPLFAHVREASKGEPIGAYDDALRVLALHADGLPPSRVCVHCFTGDEAELVALANAGVCIGITGYVGIARR
jgi:Tat protein secretion system quality control protein TatD with DNase activity